MIPRVLQPDADIAAAVAKKGQAQMVRSETDTIDTAFDFAVSHASLLRAMGR